MVYFQYKNPPGDLFRNTDIIEFPDMESEEFLVWFLPNYQGDFNVAFLNDLYKLYYDEFDKEDEKQDFLNHYDFKNKTEIKNEISVVEKELKQNALENFYRLVRNGEVRIIKK